LKKVTPYEIFCRDITSFQLEVKKDQTTYKLPAPPEASMILSCCLLKLTPYDGNDDYYDFKIHDDNISFSPNFMRDFLGDGSESEVVNITYCKLISFPATIERFGAYKEEK
jgi:hypothetical protein